MTQEQYETILACIQVGAPAIAQNLILVLNRRLELANRYVDDQLKVKNTEEPKGE